MDKQNQTKSSWPPFCLLVERQLLGPAGSKEKKIRNKKKYFHYFPMDHLEVIFIEEDKAQQGPAHAPLVPGNRFDRIQAQRKRIKNSRVKRNMSANLQSSNMIIFSTVWSICWRISGLICEFGILSLIQQRLCVGKSITGGTSDHDDLNHSHKGVIFCRSLGSSHFLSNCEIRA